MTVSAEPGSLAADDPLSIQPVSLIVWSYDPKAIFDGRERWWIPARIQLSEWVGRDPPRLSSRYPRLLRRNPNDNNTPSATLETKW